MPISLVNRFIAILALLSAGLTAVPQNITDRDPDRDYAAYPYWIDMMQNPDANFFEVQKAFYTYWQGRQTHRGDGYKPFKRWENYWLTRINPDGTFPERGYVYREYNRYVQEHPVSESLKSSSKPWTELGPKTRVEYGGYVGLGRLNAIACDPSDTSKIYVCAPSGGVWKTTDGGLNWIPLTDHMPSLGASAILIHPARTQEILVGTGDRDHGDARGIGVIRSTDGGNSWELFNTGMGEVTVGMMARSDTDPDLILAATGNGVYKTINGGKSWIRTTTVNGHFKDVKFKPGDHTVAYAVATSGEVGFYRSEDTGDTWTRVPDTAGIPKSGRMVIAVTPAAPNLVYLVCGTDVFVGCFVSQDYGKTFITQSSNPNILGYANDGSDDKSQAWYDLCLIADPVNAQVIHVGGINLWRSDNGGKTWRLTGHWTGAGANEVHADQHTLYHNPINRRLYAGNDGGIYYSDNQGIKWTEITEGLGIGQIYRLGVSKTNPMKIVTGFQDNGSATWNGTEWLTSGGGDGMECAIDPEDYQYSYVTLYYGSIDQLEFNSFSRNIAGEEVNGITESGAWITPFILDEEDGSTMVAGYKNIWITHDLKSSKISWKKISSGLRGVDNMFMTALEQSPANPKVLYASRQDQTFFRTDNLTAASTAWIDLTDGLPQKSVVSDIEAHPFDPMCVYITIGRKVFKSLDKGETWADISGSLPEIPMNTIAFDKSSIEGLYVGTDAGVYHRDQGMTDWAFFNAGMPSSAEISDLEIYYDHIDRSQSRLRASTFGRGLWETGLADAQLILPATALEAVPAGPAINLYWNAPFYAQYVTGYRIYRDNLFYGTSHSPYFSDDQVEKNKDYRYYVVAEYSGNTYAAPSNHAYAILTDPPVLPYTVDFESSTQGWSGNKLISGWHYGSSLDLGIQGNDGNFFGIESLSSTASNRVTGTLASPPIDLTSHLGNELTLRFRSAFMRTNNAGKFSVVYRLSADRDWIVLADFPAIDQPDWAWSSTTLTLPTETISANTQIGFRYDNEKQQSGGAAVDDIDLFVGSMGIPALVKPTGLKIYPVPTTGWFTVSFDQHDPADIVIRIVDLSGKQVAEKHIQSFSGSLNQQFDLSTEAKGVYLITIRSSSGDWVEKLTLR